MARGQLLDDEIYFAKAEVESSQWKAWTKLKAKLKQFGDKTYQYQELPQHL